MGWSEAVESLDSLATLSVKLPRGSGWFSSDGWAGILEGGRGLAEAFGID